MKEQFYRALTIICCIGLIGTVGGLEHGMFGFIRCLMQSALFMAGMVFFGNAAERQYRAKRRRKIKG